MKQFSTILILFSAIMLGGCKKDYLEVTPTNAISSIDAFKTTENAWAAINGIHRSLYIKYYGNQDQGGQGSNMIYMDLMGEDLVHTGQPTTFWLTAYRWTAQRTPTSNVPYFNYRFYYTIVANANMIIDNIENASGPQADKNTIRAQALAYRAWCFYQMVQLFGERYDASGANSTLGLSLVTSSENINAVPRSTVAETYVQINKDLDDAIQLFQNGTTRRNKSHLNLNVAQGLKARVALTQQNWAVAVEMAREARKGFTLMPSTEILKGFNNYDNQEWIWGIRMTAEQQIDFFSFFGYMSADFNASNIRQNPKAIFSRLYNQIPATDIRKQLWDPTGTNTAFPIPPGGIRRPYMHRKFLKAPGQDLSIGDIPLMRASEMYLIEAEALVHQGQNGPAQDILFTFVRTRDASYTKSIRTGSALVDEILIQRRVELWGEGFRFYDLKRLNQPLDRTGGNQNASFAVTLSVPAGDRRWVWLIPQPEIETSNGVVQQNPL
jgi:hypothetical protein